MSSSCWANVCAYFHVFGPTFGPFKRSWAALGPVLTLLGSRLRFPFMGHFNVIGPIFGPVKSYWAVNGPVFWACPQVVGPIFGPIFTLMD